MSSRAEAVRLAPVEPGSPARRALTGLRDYMLRGSDERRSWPDSAFEPVRMSAIALYAHLSVKTRMPLLSVVVDPHGVSANPGLIEFVVDTASSRTILVPRDADLLGLSLESGRSETVFGMHKEPVSCIPLNTTMWFLAALRATEETAYVATDAEVLVARRKRLNEKMYSVLGLDLLSRFSVKIDPGRVVLRPQESALDMFRAYRQVER
jgi:hypothetical protein